MQSMSSARQSEVKAWEEETLACEHTLTLEQFATGPILASGTPPHPFLLGAICLINDQAWHTVRNAISKKTFGFV